MNAQQTKQKGFTIIEVVLVLAIAGLIFLMVFIALPALQRNQRDTARKNDASAIASAVTAFTGNNRGKKPTAAQIVQYASNLSENIKRGDDGAIAADAITVETPTSFPASAAPEDSIAAVTYGSACDTIDTTKATLKKGTARQLTVVLKLESGNGSYYCLDS